MERGVVRTMARSSKALEAALDDDGRREGGWLPFEGQPDWSRAEGGSILAVSCCVHVGRGGGGWCNSETATLTFGFLKPVPRLPKHDASSVGLSCLLEDRLMRLADYQHCHTSSLILCEVLAEDDEKS